MGRSEPSMDPSLILLDACCAINLLASGSAAEIVAALPEDVAVADFVLKHEVLSVGDGSSQVSLLPLVEQGLIEVLRPTTDTEEEAFVDLALQLDDGEAMTGALAMHRGALVATDDRKAIRILTGRTPPVEIRRTSELVRAWTEACNVPPAHVRRVLGDIQDRASFHPPGDDPLREWWISSAQDRDSATP